MNYSFTDVRFCEMCGSPSDSHKILGIRLNKSQGLKPKKKTGIAVTIQKCSNCKLIYSNPLPIPSDIQDHYGTPPENYWKPEYFEWTPNYFSYQIKEASELLGGKVENLKALDIGAGIGKAMKSLDHAGFDTYGMEPSIPFFEKAISEMGIDPNKLKLGPVESIEYEPESFDFITFGAVFEHLYFPGNTLEKVAKWLKPGGVIQIEVPSSSWLIPKFMNAYFRMIGTTFTTHLSPMHSPFHLYEFDLKSFEQLSDKLGLKVEKSRYEVCDIYYMPGFIKPLLHRYMKRTNKGMQLTVYLKKVKDIA